MLAASSRISSRIGRQALCAACGLLRSAGVRKMSSSLSHKPIRPKRKVGGLFRIIGLSIVPITCAYLGTWQVRRMKWKDGLIAKEKEEEKNPPIEMPYDLSELDGLEWKKVKFRGVFDHSKEQFIGPRPLIKPAALEDHITYGGYVVLTPFRCADNGRWILVNRGWVSRANKNPRYRMGGQVEGEVEFVAKVRRGEGRPTGVKANKNNTSPNSWTYKDLPALAKYCQTEPYLVDVVLADSHPDGPLGGQSMPHLTNKHLEYVVTWYGIAIVSGFVVLSMLRKYTQRVRNQRKYALKKELQARQASLAPRSTEDGGTAV